MYGVSIIYNVNRSHNMLCVSYILNKVENFDNRRSRVRLRAWLRLIKQTVRGIKNGIN